MVKKSTKFLYLSLTAALTGTALSACYWQTNRYLQSRQRWSLIARQLSKEQPDSLEKLKETELYPMKYVQVKGKMGKEVMLVSRAREGRMGYLIVRACRFGHEQDKGERVMLVVQGWIPKDYQYHPVTQIKTVKGILRQKQKKDYLHQKLPLQQIKRFNINTYISIPQAITQLSLPSSNLYQNFYLQILKELSPSSSSASSSSPYPYQYSIDNFQLPYLTPDKHRAYALFWGLTSAVGIGAIVKVIAM